MRLGRSVWRDGFLCDAILTDPPYGIREGAKKLKRKEKEAYSKDFYRFHQYSLSDLYLDLSVRFCMLEHLEQVWEVELCICFPWYR